MAEISIDREAFEILEKGELEAAKGDSRLASFLANKFREGDERARADAGAKADWIYNIWTYRF